MSCISPGGATLYKTVDDKTVDENEDSGHVKSNTAFKCL